MTGRTLYVGRDPRTEEGCDDGGRTGCSSRGGGGEARNRNREGRHRGGPELPGKLTRREPAGLCRLGGEHRGCLEGIFRNAERRDRSRSGAKRRDREWESRSLAEVGRGHAPTAARNAGGLPGRGARRPGPGRGKESREPAVAARRLQEGHARGWAPRQPI